MQKDHTGFICCEVFQKQMHTMHFINLEKKKQNDGIIRCSMFSCCNGDVLAHREWVNENQAQTASWSKQ